VAVLDGVAQDPGVRQAFRMAGFVRSEAASRVWMMNCASLDSRRCSPWASRANEDSLSASEVGDNLR
jgi:hypothetical protein